MRTYLIHTIKNYRPDSQSMIIPAIIVFLVIIVMTCEASKDSADIETYFQITSDKPINNESDNRKEIAIFN